MRLAELLLLVLGVNGVAFADLGEIVVFLKPFVLGWRGVNEGESTLNLRYGQFFGFQAYRQ